MLAKRTRAAWITYGVLLTVAVALLAILLYPLRVPLFLGAVLAGTLWGWQRWLSTRLGGRRRLAAGLLTASVVLFLLVPLALASAFAVHEAMEATRFVRAMVKTGGFERLVERLPSSLRGNGERIVAALPESLDELGQALGGGRVAQAVGGALRITAGLAFKLVALVLTLFVLLVDGGRLVDWIAAISPLRAEETLRLVTRVRHVARSLVGSTLITAVAQASVATIGFLIARTPNALFFGLLTFFAAFIPAVGTALIGLPVAALLWLLGHPWAALFVALWSVLVVGLLDNLVKPLLMKDGMKVSGIVVLLSLFGGIAVFGASGFIAGPLIISFWLGVVHLGREGLVLAGPPHVTELPAIRP